MTTTIMKSTFQPINRRRCIRVSAALCLLVGLFWALGLRAQSPDEHASHHPGQAGGAMPAAGAMSAAPGAAPGMGAMPAAGGSPAPGGMGRGMMEGMGEMMKGMMGGAKTKELYPSLMDLPDLPLTKRLEVEQQAGERMRSGVALMNESLDYLLQATEQQNYTAMQAGTANLREGLARFESGLAAQRALAEGKAPRNVALTWFKRDMNLLPFPGADTKHVGLDVYHWFVMVLLIAFALAMVVMYFFKMRRAAALFGRIEADQGAPLPGATPGGMPSSGPLAPTPVPTPQPGAPGNPGNAPPGPVMGVYSKSRKKGYRLFTGRENYNEWRFTEQTMLNQAPSGPPPAPGPGIGR